MVARSWFTKQCLNNLCCPSCNTTPFYNENGLETTINHVDNLFHTTNFFQIWYLFLIAHSYPLTLVIKYMYYAASPGKWSLSDNISWQLEWMYTSLTLRDHNLCFYWEVINAPPWEIITLFYVKAYMKFVSWIWQCFLTSSFNVVFLLPTNQSTLSVPRSFDQMQTGYTYGCGI